MAASSGLPSLAEIEAFLCSSNNFYVLQTDVIPTFGLTFSQIDIRLYHAQEDEVNIRIPCGALFANALKYIENARRGEFPETPDKITSRCSGKEPALTRHERAAEIESTDKRNAFDKLCKVMSKFSTERILREEVIRLNKLDSESKVNLHIADTFLMALIDDGQCVVNASHGKDIDMIAGNRTVVTPDKAGWNGLGIGNRNAWYGELDMIVRPSGPSATAVAHRMELEEDDGFPGNSVAVEGKSTGDILEGCRFSQVVSSAITFSFVYQSRHKDREALIPTIQVSKDGFDVFFYDCKEDTLIGQLFGWSRVSLIFLWAILNYRLFPPQIPSRYSTYKFGYRNSANSGKGFLNLQEGEFYYGECIHSSSPFREPYSLSRRCIPMAQVNF